jgi:hypothetical protein
MSTPPVVMPGPSTWATNEKAEPHANVHRVRIEAHGPSVGAVSAALHAVAHRIVGINGVEDSIFVGHEVYERDINEPEGSTAYKGRLVVHPAINLTTEASDG